MRDDYDVEKRMVAGSRAMGALSDYWNNDHVDIGFTNTDYLWQSQ